MTVQSHTKELLIKAAEEKLGRGRGAEWSNHDFELLSEDIFRRTGKQLSVSTLKRLWNRTSTRNRASVSTLNILAEYAGFEDWRKFCLTREPVTRKPSVRRLKRYLWPVILGMAAFGLYSFYQLNDRNPQVIPDNEQILFSLKKITEGYPNTVIFEYDVGDLSFDSLAIQQSWDKSRRIDLEKSKGLVTSTYYYPGYFLAKLVVNDQIIREKDLYIPTHGWQGMVDDSNGDIRYLDEKIQFSPGSIRFDSATIGNPVKGDEFALVNLLPEPVIDSRNFKLKVRYLTGSAAEHSVCKFTALVITGTREVIAFQQSKKGCVGDLSAFINKDMISGRDTDLSGLALTDEGYAEVELEVKDLQLTIKVNGQLAFTHQMKEDIGLIGGVQWYTEDPGEISQLIISDKNHQWDLLLDPNFENSVNLLSGDQ